MSEFALLPTLYCPTNPPIKGASAINENASSILQNDILIIDNRFLAVTQYKLVKNDENAITDDRLSVIDDLINDPMEVFDQIKVEFQTSSSTLKKVLLLMFAPKSWDHRRFAKESGASERQTRKGKKLVADR